MLTLDPKQLELLADEATAAEATGGIQMISTRNGRLTLNGMPIVGDTINAIILCSPIERNYYGDAPWDPDNTAPPVCTAIGTNVMELKPSERSSKPQSPSCEACPKNQWGSSLTGTRRGKACKESRKIVFVESELVTDEESAQKATLYGIRPPVNSIGTFSTFVKKISVGLRKPLFCVRVKISVIPDNKKQFIMTFTLIEEIKTTSLLLALMERSKRESQLLLNYETAESDAGDVEEETAF